MDYSIPLTGDEPSAYVIQVQGPVSDHLADYLGCLSISVGGEPDQPVTTLCGQTMDQAALMGVLNNLYGMGYTLLSFEFQSIHSTEVNDD
ncbi:MAG: hypothetical protein GY759_21210 [Chloroflexi bacterium]|nr:hypothetical protein [Chloroflexota bacterium]